MPGAAGADGPAAVVGIVGGSRSDFPVLEKAKALLDELGIPSELRVVSAHRTPDLLFRYAETAAARGIRAIVAGAGGAAHLPGMLAAKTQLPVIGVPIPTEHRGGARGVPGRPDVRGPRRREQRGGARVRARPGRARTGWPAGRALTRA